MLIPPHKQVFIREVCECAKVSDSLNYNIFYNILIFIMIFFLTQPQLDVGKYVNKTFNVDLCSFWKLLLFLYFL